MNGEILLAEDVPRTFAELVIEAHCASTGDGFSIALSGGSTARRCYSSLAAATDASFWSSVELFWGDERCVDLDHPDSNYRLAREAIGGGFDQARALHPMRCESTDSPEPRNSPDSDPAPHFGDAEQYDALIADRSPIDVLHLGLGPDGHTASLFPESRALDPPPGRLVVTNRDPLGNNPHLRMTLTFEAIATARLVLVTVEGASKQDALRRVIDGDRGTPASRIDASRVVWIVDGAALGSSSPR